jgi:hypothetical protein
MCKYPTRISLIILLLSLISCDACKEKPQKQQPEQESIEALKKEIQGLELKRKQQISKLMDEWKENAPFKTLEAALKQGEIDKVYQEFIKLVVETAATAQKKACDEKFIQGYLEAEKEAAKKQAEDYSREKFAVAVLEKDLYQVYEMYFPGEYLGKRKKQEVEDYFKKLEKKEKEGTLTDDDEKKHLQLIRNWKAVEPTLKLEQEKREALKKLEEAKKS